MSREISTPSSRDVHDLVIIGSGMGGLGAAAMLKDQCTGRVAILERANELGGTWRDNHYPNIACDTPIDIYAYSFFPGRKWTTNFAPGGEIQEYLHDLARHYDVYDLITYDTEVSSAVWNGADATWDVTSTDDRSWKTRYLIWSGGFLSTPVVPRLPGMERFRGEMFHTAQWPDEVDLSDKRVAVVGAGASAIQVVPYVADHANEAYSFVRTPSYVLPRPEVFFTPEERARPEFLEEQRQRRYDWFERFEAVTKARFPMDSDVIADQEADWRKHFNEFVKDPEVRRILTPTYRYGCKRPLFSSAYYPAMDSDNMTVIGTGVREVTEDGLIDYNGKSYAFDTIIWATGFDPSHMLGKLDIVGRGGTHMADLWEDIPSAYYGALVKGFPNLFLLGGPNSGSTSQSDAFEAQFWLISEIMRICRHEGISTVEVSEEVHDSFNERIQKMGDASVLVQGGCNSFYRSPKTGGVFTHWPSTIEAFHSEIKNGAIDRLTFRTSEVSA